MGEASKKIVHLEEKEMSEKVRKEAPGPTKVLLDGVNVFNDDLSLKPEPPEGPMICDSSLKFDQNELAILAKGPKFMVRSELQSEDFMVEMEQMIVKKKFDEKNEDVLDDSKDDCAVFVNGNGATAHVQ